MSVTRRTFAAGLASLLGAPSLPVLRERVLDAGRPILVKPTGAIQNLHIYEHELSPLASTATMKTFRVTSAHHGAIYGASTGMTSMTRKNLPTS